MHIDALIHTFRLLDIVDIIIVAIGIYYLYKLLKDTRAVSLLKGLVMLAILNLLSHLLNLYVMAAARVMSREHTGALIVFEREVGLNDFVDTGILIDAVLSRELIKNIFVPSTPLHDGALIIRDGRIRAAGCLLPLTEDRTLSTELGTRHRAAIGLSEQTDAVVVVVSEETGTISYTYGGHIYRHLPEDQIKEALRTFMERPRQTITSMWKWRANK